MKVPPPVTDTVAPLGPNARAVLEERRLADIPIVVSDLMPPHSWMLVSHKQPSPRPTVLNLIADIAAGIRVLRDRDGVEITEAQVMERASNIVTGLIGNFRIEEA